MIERVDALKRSYAAVKNLGYKGSYTILQKRLELLKNLLLHGQDLEGY